MSRFIAVLFAATSINFTGLCMELQDIKHEGQPIEQSEWIDVNDENIEQADSMTQKPDQENEATRATDTNLHEPPSTLHYGDVVILSGGGLISLGYGFHAYILPWIKTHFRKKSIPYKP